MGRLNAHMHDKVMIANSRAAVVSARRNLADQYFSLHDNTYNFDDTNLLAIGEIASQGNGTFDSGWNSEWVVSAQNLAARPSQANRCSQNRDVDSG